MANMQDKRSAFEDQWRDAFDDAEMTPSAGLWKNIDNQLTQQENGKYRRGFIFYRSLAAACVVCLLALGYYVLHDSLQQSESMLGQETPATPPADADANPASEALADEMNRVPQPDESLAQGTPNSRIPREPIDDRPATSTEEPTEQPATLALAPQARSQSAKAGNAVSANTAAFADEERLDSNISRANVLNRTSASDPAYLATLGPATDEPGQPAWIKTIDKLYRVPQLFAKEEEEDSEQAGRLFAGLNLATNYFDPNFSQGSGGALFAANADAMPQAISADRQLAQSTLSTAESYNTQNVSSGLENRPQISISYGVDVGMMLTKRLSLESGIDYGQMNSNTSTMLVAEDFSRGQRIPLLVSTAQDVQNSSTRTRFTGREQQLTNTFEIISVPLKLGYNLQFNKLNINLSSGVAANFFLNNRLSDKSGQLSTVNLSANSAGSPYKQLYYSAVFSGGLSYLLTRNYAISVAPNYNLALSNLTEGGYNFSSQPNNFGIDFGVRYIFQ